jgi:hypothetical protein
VFGTQWPLRLTQNPRANLDLLPPDLAGTKLAVATSIFDRAIASERARDNPTGGN